MNLLLSFRHAARAVTALTILGLGLPAFAAYPVPFKGRADAVITSVVDTPPATRELTASATGQATHLGSFTRTESLTIDLIAGTFTGKIVFTADNGDLLKVDVEGYFIAPMGAAAEGTYLFKGGSGRFLNASGSAAFQATANGTGFDVRFSGTIQY